MATTQTLDSLLQQVLASQWESIFNTPDTHDSLILAATSAMVQSASLNDGRDGNSEPLWNSSPTMPFHFNPELLVTALDSILSGRVSISEPIPFTSYSGIGDNSNARGQVKDEFLQWMLLPTDLWFKAERDLEVQWHSQGRLMGRFRRPQAPCRLETQLCANYWDHARLTSSTHIGTGGSPPVNILKIAVDYYVEDEQGIGSKQSGELVMGQLTNGRVLWWEHLATYLSDEKAAVFKLSEGRLAITEDDKTRLIDLVNHLTPHPTNFLGGEKAPNHS